MNLVSILDSVSEDASKLMSCNQTCWCISTWIYLKIQSALSSVSQVKIQCCAVIASVTLADPQWNGLLLLCLSTHECEESLAGF